MHISKPIVELRDIARVFGAGEAAVRACDRINLTIESGEYCAIMGQSGSGKSTLMNIIGCLDRPSSGHYLLDGQNVSKLGKNRLARIRNRKIGFIFQRYELLPSLSAVENVILPMMYAGMGMRERHRRAVAALQRVGLGHRLDKRPAQLSGGQQQRVAIARAIVNRPLLLLADEPTGALDTHSTEELMAIFDQLHRNGMTLIMVTHSHRVASYSDRIIMMSDGQVVSDRLSPEQVNQMAPL